MGKDTSIEYADSSGNLQMGCDGCELWNEATGIFTCYAGTQTRKYEGRKGWPVKFEQPEIFPYRLDEIVGWSDLNGQDRRLKPWLSGLPRVVFLNDMGDAWTKSLPLDWMQPYISRLAASPHFYLALTKNHKRMIRFWLDVMGGRVPSNFILGVSVTSPETASRAVDLAAFKQETGNRAKIWVSYEPALGLPSKLHALIKYKLIDWIVPGGESDQQTAARFTEPETILQVIEWGERYGVPVFVKQLGAPLACALGLEDAKGGDWTEWPDEFKVRKMPEIAPQMLF
jgi:protein gp37